MNEIIEFSGIRPHIQLPVRTYSTGMRARLGFSIAHMLHPDILLIGFGNPKQELWFNRNRHKLKTSVTIGIGGTYEFIVGSVSRAPIWVQKIGMEWIYRIFQDPNQTHARYLQVGSIPWQPRYLSP